MSNPMWLEVKWELNNTRRTSCVSSHEIQAASLSLTYRGQQINTSPPPGGEKTVRPCPFPTSYVHLHLWFSIQDTPKLPTKHVEQRTSPAPPSSAFSTPGRVLGSSSPELLRDAYTGQRIYSPTDPNHPSRRPISSAFKKKYKRYYDEASPQMPQHLFVRPVTSFICIHYDASRDLSGISPVSKATNMLVLIMNLTLMPTPFMIIYSWLVFISPRHLSLKPQRHIISSLY